MQVSVDWLKDYVTVKGSAKDIAERLTMTLNEVDEITSQTHLKDIVVGEILDIRPHPDADNLSVTRVSIGNRTLEIICGADNIEVGSKVPVALPGVTLPSGLEIAKREIRGVASEGMLCSARELAIGEDHQGIWLLPANSRSGTPVSEAIGSDGESFELEVLANRPDCMGHLGVAREVAAAFDTALNEPELKTPDRPVKGSYKVTLPKDGSCTRYSLAHLTGLTNGESPDWLKKRLNAVGLKPISAIVDLTNFVMLEYGQPMHAMDAGKIASPSIRVRLAKQGESLRTLDGKEHRVPAGTVLIADPKKPLGLAGIMGGASSEVTPETTEIVLECAHFDPVKIRRASRALGIRTEASARFERGISEALVRPAIRRAVDLLSEICGGELKQLSDTYPKRAKQAVIKLDIRETGDFLGLDLKPAAVKKLLSGLGFTIKGTGQTLTVTPPLWRTDVSETVDLYEEVARLSGYDTIPSTMPTGPLMVPDKPAIHELSGRLRDILIQAGLTEILTHSLVGDRLLEKAGWLNEGFVEMANPLSEDHRYLRRSLEPRHLETVTENLRWREQLSLFEFGTVFKTKSGDQETPEEKKRLLVTLAGSKAGRSGLLDVKGLLSLVLDRLHLPTSGVSFVPLQRPQYQSGLQFDIVYQKTVIGHVATYGQPIKWKAREISFLSLELDRLVTLLPDGFSISPLPSYPPVNRDLSMFIGDDISYADVATLIKQAAGKLLFSIGNPAEYRQQDKRSLTVHLEFRLPDRTLTDQEVHQAMAKITTALTKRGLQIRD